MMPDLNCLLEKIRKKFESRAWKAPLDTHVGIALVAGGQPRALVRKVALQLNSPHCYL